MVYVGTGKGYRVLFFSSGHAITGHNITVRIDLKAQRHNAELTRKRFIGGLDVANADAHAHAATTAAEIKALGGG